MTALRQAVLVALCYGVAVAATPVFVLLTQSVFLSTMGEDVSSLWREWPSLIFTGAIITGIYAALPFLCAIGALRVLGLRNWWAHAMLGAPVSYVALGLFAHLWVPNVDQLPYWVAGFGSGYTYWLCRRGLVPLWRT